MTGRWRKSMLAVMLLLLLPLRGDTTSPYIIHIDVELKQLTVWQDDEEIRRYTCATGAWQTPTPVGTFRINSRFHGEMSGFGTCFLGMDVPWGQYGIHGTNKPESIGHNASHGCIRLSVADSEALYALVPNGTKVVIECGAYGELGDTLRQLRHGDRSSTVRAVQRKLRALGFYYGFPDGIYGDGTVTAVLCARKALGLPQSEQVDWAFYQAIGLTPFE